MSQWEVIETMCGNHVMPIDDLKPHDADQRCWCTPFDDEGVWVHNSKDRRELYERGEMRKS
jgi:hypothetical protein